MSHEMRRGSVYCPITQAGATTLILIFSAATLPFGLDASLFGILVSAILFFPLSLILNGGHRHAR